MRFPCTLAIALAFLCAVTPALAQPVGTYASGILHQPLGGAVLGAVEGRRLPVHNLGSSGNDGVEVRCHSAWGAAVGVDMSGFSVGGTPDRELRVRPKGWDGTIKGTLRMYNSSTGTSMLTADFSDIGATESSYVEYDGAGDVVGSGIMPSAGLAAVWCPPGQYSVVYFILGIVSYGPPVQWSVTVVYGCSTCPEPWFNCLDTSTNRTVVISPIVPAGAPGMSDLDSLLVTGRDLPDLDGDGSPDLVVGNADLKFFPVPCPPWDCLALDTGFQNARWGLGQAHISEECTPDSVGGCDETDRRLVVANIGSSGEDGVAINLPTNGGSVAAARGTKGCCRGHVIIMKLYDDGSQELRAGGGKELSVSRTETLDPNGTEELDADFSSLGATGYVLTLFGTSGGVLGPPDGTAFFSGGPKPVFTNRCPPGAQEWWINMGPSSNPVWVFQGCIGGGYDFVLPGYGPVPNVDSFRVRALDALTSFGNRVRLEIVSDDPDGLVFDDFVITQAITGDLNCDNAVTFRDINPFVLRLSSPAAYHAAFPGCPDTNGDINGDGSINFRDINPFVALLAGQH